MSNETSPVCEDCRHKLVSKSHPHSPTYWACERGVEWINDREMRRLCISERKTGECGPEGRNWERAA